MTEITTKAVSAEQAAREQALTQKVMSSFEDTPDLRLREIVQALTKHLHEFIREVRLSEEEWREEP